MSVSTLLDAPNPATAWANATVAGSLSTVVAASIVELSVVEDSVVVVVSPIVDSFSVKSSSGVENSVVVVVSSMQSS